MANYGVRKMRGKTKKKGAARADGPSFEVGSGPGVKRRPMGSQAGGRASKRVIAKPADGPTAKLGAHPRPTAKAVPAGPKPKGTVTSRPGKPPSIVTPGRSSMGTPRMSVGEPASSATRIKPKKTGSAGATKPPRFSQGKPTASRI